MCVTSSSGHECVCGNFSAFVKHTIPLAFCLYSSEVSRSQHPQKAAPESCLCSSKLPIVQRLCSIFTKAVGDYSSDSGVAEDDSGKKKTTRTNK